MARSYLVEYFTSLSNLRTLLGYGASDPSDVDLTRAANAAIRWVEQRCGQPFVALTETRRFFGTGRRELPLDRALISLTSITVDGTALSSLTGILAGVELGPGIHEPAWHRNPRLLLSESATIGSWTRTSYAGVPNVAITGRWGAVEGDASAPTLIPAIQDALLILIHLSAASPSDDDIRLSKRWGAQSAMSIGGRSATVDASASGGFVSDPRVETVIRAHRAPPRIVSTL